MDVQKKSPSKILVSVGLVILLAGVLFVFLRSGEQASEIPPDLSSPLTPTPYPLPTKAFELPPLVTIDPETVSEEIGPWMDPVQIKEAGQPQAENEYVDLYSVNGYLPIELSWWEREAGPVYEYVRQRLGVTLPEKAIVTFAPPESNNCPARGRTFREQPVIVIFADEETSREQILGVLAHELGHVLSFEKYNHLSDLALTEGIATWAAGEYWDKWQGFDFHSGVQSFIKDGTYLPLVQNYNLEKAYDPDAPDCLRHRDVLYTEMASFIDYLMEQYGTERLSILFDVRPTETRDNKNIMYPPDYKGVYGLELNQLEYEWLKTIIQSNP